MAYEDKMNVIFDQITGIVTVYFRGQKVELPNKYSSQAEGIKAGEQWCRGQGWQG